MTPWKALANRAMACQAHHYAAGYTRCRSRM